MTLDELQDYLRKKLRTAYNLGQTYWQQADSEYRRDHKKSVETANKFCELIEHVVSAVTFEMNRASAAQESAPAELPTTTIERWQDRLRLCPSREELMAAMQSEIDDWRAAAPASPQPAIVKADTPEYTQYECYHCGSGCTVHKLQPVAKVLTDAEIIEIKKRVSVRYNSAWHISDSAACEFARAILAASTPTTLTGEKDA